MMEDVQRVVVGAAAHAGYVHHGDFASGDLDSDDSFLSAAAKITARVEGDSGGSGDRRRVRDGVSTSGRGGIEGSVRPPQDTGADADANAGADASTSMAGLHGRKLMQASATEIYLELLIINDKARVDQYPGNLALMHSARGRRVQGCTRL
jgi:hypothetical protein